MPTTFVIDCETSAEDLSWMPKTDVLTLVEAAARREEPVDKYVATCPALAHVVLVGMLNVETGGRCVAYDSRLVDVDAQAADLDGVRLMAAGGEAALLMIVHDLLGKAQRLVTFNGRGFDLPLLLLRAMRHGLTPARIVERSAWQKPWESEPHVDVLARLTFGGATGRYPLAAYGIGLGAGNPKQAGDGAGVSALVEARNGTDLARYCLGDVETTAALAVKAGVLEVAAQRAA